MVYDYTDDPKKTFKEDYELKSVIGHGTKGEVRMCVHRRSKAKRAVKIIKTKSMSD